MPARSTAAVPWSRSALSDAMCPVRVVWYAGHLLVRPSSETPPSRVIVSPCLDLLRTVVSRSVIILYFSVLPQRGVSSPVPLSLPRIQRYFSSVRNMPVLPCQGAGTRQHSITSQEQAHRPALSSGVSFTAL